MMSINLLCKIGIALLIGITLFAACTGSEKGSSKIHDDCESNGELVFQSGFEGTCKVIPDGSINNKIVGIDTSLPEKNDWIIDLEQIAGVKSVNINYTGGDSTKRFVKIVPEPGNPSNKVLWFWLNDSWLASENQEKARVQIDAYGIEGGYREFYQSVRVFLTKDFNILKSYPHRIGWLTISEFWNNEWWVAGEKYGFRVTLGIGKSSAEENDLNFILNGEDAGQIEVWNGHSDASQRIKVPIGKWFTMEYYFKEGNSETGRFYMAITPDGETKQVVFDIYNFTHNTSNNTPTGLTGYNPMKLYTSKDIVSYVNSQGKTLQIYWDDFKLWKNKQPSLYN